MAYPLFISDMSSYREKFNTVNSRYMTNEQKERTRLTISYHPGLFWPAALSSTTLTNYLHSSDIDSTQGHSMAKRG